MRCLSVVSLFLFLGVLLAGSGRAADNEKEPAVRKFTMSPIGWVRKTEGHTTIVVDKKYQEGLLGIDKCPEIWVLWWFDRSDTPEKRATLKVSPTRGVFSTHANLRPNLIAMTRCKIISVKDNVIEIEKIDAFADTPVLDLKN